MIALSLGVLGGTLSRLLARLTFAGSLGSLRRFRARRSDIVGAFGRLGSGLALVGRLSFGCRSFLGSGSLLGRSFSSRGLLRSLFGNRLGLGGRLRSRGLNLVGDHGLSFLLRRGSSLGGLRFLGGASLGALLGLLARLSLVRVVARRTLLEAG